MITSLRILRPSFPIKYLSDRGKVTVSRVQGEALKGPNRTRNVGVMAHIDAGKTTTTERFLYYSGTISTPGEVHHGDTVTDFLPQERERGITIQSAVVSFPWKDFTINLIDTPGHVDFTFEVQRSLRVVDSAVTILDASAGVEAQTLTVWRQASDYNLPRIIFLNKMDKGTASVDLCLESIEEKLKCNCLLLQEPVYEKTGVRGKSSGLCGIIDIVDMKKLLFERETKGSRIISIDVSEDAMVQKKRGQLVEQIADLDAKLADLIIEKESIESISRNDVHRALRRVTTSVSGTPVLLGSSFKYIGVQPLMDAVLAYLPDPTERLLGDAVVNAYGNELCCFAFKTMHDDQLGPLTFLRVFSGTITHNHKIYNVSRGKNEKIAKIYLPLADELREVHEASAGQVVIVSGLKDTITGDTLSTSHTACSSVAKKLAKKRKDEEVRAVLSGVDIPKPVFFCSVEPASISQQKGLDSALECLQREDPSLHVHVDPDTNQTILSGMGELHLEVINERLKTEFKVEADLGKIQIAFKETILAPATKRINFERRLGEESHKIVIELELIPDRDTTTSAPKLKVYRGRDKEKSENLALVTEKQLKHIRNGIESAMRFGPKLSFPIINIQPVLHWYEAAKWMSETLIEAAAAKCFRECVQEQHIYLLEPIVILEIAVDERFQTAVLDDLHRRRFMLQEVDQRHGNKVITGSAPLCELMGYSTALRTVSSGLATFTMSFSHYQVVNNSVEEQKIVASVKGF